MKQSIQFPMVTKSENAYRSMHWRRARAITKHQRSEVRLFFTQLERHNGHRFDVTLTRIASAELDGDNLQGAMKGIRDEVAAWLGIDDRSPRIQWHYSQELCQRGYACVRVVIDDDSGDPSVASHVLGVAPPVLREPGTKARRSRPAQAKLPLALKSYALLPWEQVEHGAAVVVELDALASDDQPPATIKVQAPAHVQRASVQGRRCRIEIDGGSAVLYRHRYRHAKLGDCWMYLTSPPGAGERIDDENGEGDDKSEGAHRG